LPTITPREKGRCDVAIIWLSRQSVLRRTIGEQLQESIPITSQLLEEVVDKVLPYERFRIMPSYNEKTGEITIDLEFEGAQSA